MNQSNEQMKSDLSKQIQQTSDPIIKRVLEKRLKEINKEVKK